MDLFPVFGYLFFSLPNSGSEKNYVEKTSCATCRSMIPRLRIPKTAIDIEFSSCFNSFFLKKTTRPIYSLQISIPNFLRKTIPSKNWCFFALRHNFDSPKFPKKAIDLGTIEATRGSNCFFSTTKGLISSIGV